MDERIKKALNDLDSATVLNQLNPILSNDLIKNNNNNNSSGYISNNKNNNNNSLNNNKNNKNNIILTSDSNDNNNSNNNNVSFNDNDLNNENSTTTNINNNDLNNSQSLLYTSYRPWNNTDYYNRVRTFTISNWFAKPTEIDPLQCSRYGWINCEPDMLECETCKKRLYFKIPPTLNKNLVLNRVQEFITSLQTSGHRDNCPWRDNGCPSFFSRLLDLPFQTQLEAFIKRSQNIYNNITKLPILSEEFHQQWIDKQKIEKDINILNSIIKITNLPIDDIKSKVSCLLALCGWDFNLTSPSSTSLTSTSDNNEKENKSSIYCSYCQRVCGIWNFKDNKSKVNPFYEESIANSGDSSSIVGSKRKRDDLEDRQSIQFERALAQSFNYSNIFSNNNNNNSSSSSISKPNTFISAFSGNFQTSFGSINNINNSNNNSLDNSNSVNKISAGWSWGETFLNSQPTDFKHALESKSNSKTEFSPVREHRWFCPWMLSVNLNNNKNISDNSSNQDKNQSNYSNKEINIDKDKDFEKELESNNNNNSSLISGWENLLILLLNQQCTHESKDSEFKETKYHSIIKSLTEK